MYILNLILDCTLFVILYNESTKTELYNAKFDCTKPI